MSLKTQLGAWSPVDLILGLRFVSLWPNASRWECGSGRELFVMQDVRPVLWWNTKFLLIALANLLLCLLAPVCSQVCDANKARTLSTGLLSAKFTRQNGVNMLTHGLMWTAWTSSFPLTNQRHLQDQQIHYRSPCEGTDFKGNSVETLDAHPQCW